jgi:hypothetical protein
MEGLDVLFLFVLFRQFVAFLVEVQANVFGANGDVNRGLELADIQVVIQRVLNNVLEVGDVDAREESSNPDRIAGGTVYCSTLGLDASHRILGGLATSRPNLN